MKVLFLSLWYPNKYDAMSGLFVRKHAQAVAMKDDVQVIYLSPNNVSKKYELEFQEVNGVKELIIYYPNTTFIPLKMIRFLKAYNKGFKYIFKSWGKPNVTHVNVRSEERRVGKEC